MPPEIYEVVAQGARYWFLFLMALIVWRSWRWYRKDQKQAKKRRKLLPDAGFVGEMVVMESGTLHKGEVFPVPNEGTLGSLRTNDLCVQDKGVAKRHLWFRFEEREGLIVEPLGKNAVTVDGRAYERKGDPLVMAHGSRLYVGDCELRLRLFAGFECVGYAARRAEPEPQPQPQPQPEAQTYTPEQLAAWQQQWMQQQMQAMQQAYQLGYEQAAQQWQEEEEACDEADEDSLPYEMAQIAQEEGMVDHSMFMRPEGHAKPQAPEYEPEAPKPVQEESFYPPEAEEEWLDDEDGWDAFDEDMTDAASAPPRSAYVGRDESERAKKELWDKYFGGGGVR